MHPGKAASQSGHAFLGSFLQAQTVEPDTANRYLQQSPGTKVVLGAKNLDTILLVQAQLSAHGIPHYLVADSGCANFFGGQLTITALGVGPSVHPKLKQILKRLQLLP